MGRQRKHVGLRPRNPGLIPATASRVMQHPRGVIGTYLGAEIPAVLPKKGTDAAAQIQHRATAAQQAACLQPARDDAPPVAHKDIADLRGVSVRELVPITGIHHARRLACPGGGADTSAGSPVGPAALALGLRGVAACGDLARGVGASAGPTTVRRTPPFS